MKDLLTFLFFTSGALMAEGAVEILIANVVVFLVMAMMIGFLIAFIRLGKKPPEDQTYYQRKKQNSRR